MGQTFFKRTCKEPSQKLFLTIQIFLGREDFDFDFGVIIFQFWRAPSPSAKLTSRG
jgi:hypothetical protein